MIMILWLFWRSFSDPDCLYICMSQIVRYLTCDGASGHLRSATLVTVCRVLREAPEREGGLLHGETACSAGLQSLSACCSIQGTRSHLYLWAPFGEVVVLKVFQKLY